MSYRPVGFTTNNSDYNSRDHDRPTREPTHDPLADAFGDTFGSPPSWQLSDVFDETGGMKFFRCFATKPCFTLVDVYNIRPNPNHFEDCDVGEAMQKMRDLAIAKAETISVQVQAHNLAHPSEKFGLIQIIGADAITKDDVARASQGEIVVTSVT
jgi:hypothetical protein